MMRTISFFTLLVFFLSACGGNNTEAEATTEAPTTPQAETAPPAQPSEPIEGVEISLKPEAVDFPDAAITSMSYQDGIFRFGVAGTNYTLGAQTPDATSAMCANSAKGQHIHLILDNEPYAAKYEAQFDYDVADGEHYMMAFLSRSYHESIKHDNAFKALKIQVEDKTITNMEAIAMPMLFYSRPKGTYTGKDTENIMLDFYPINVELGIKHQVKAEVAGHTFMLDQWKPYFLKGLPMGEHTVTLTLTDMNGNVLETPYNPVSRTITLAPSPDQVQ